MMGLLCVARAASRFFPFDCTICMNRRSCDYTTNANIDWVFFFVSFSDRNSFSRLLVRCVVCQCCICMWIGSRAINNVQMMPTPISMRSPMVLCEAENANNWFIICDNCVCVSLVNTQYYVPTGDKWEIIEKNSLKNTTQPVVQQFVCCSHQPYSVVVLFRSMSLFAYGQLSATKVWLMACLHIFYSSFLLCFHVLTTLYTVKRHCFSCWSSKSIVISVIIILVDSIFGQNIIIIQLLLSEVIKKYPIFCHLWQLVTTLLQASGNTYCSPFGVFQGKILHARQFIVQKRFKPSHSNIFWKGSD